MRRHRFIIMALALLVTLAMSCLFFIQSLTDTGNTSSTLGMATANAASGGNLTLPYAYDGSTTGPQYGFSVTNGGNLDLPPLPPQGNLSLPYDGSTSSPHPGFSVTNSSGTIAIRGLATNSGNLINYGGYFEAYGTSGRAVTGAVKGNQARGVYGLATGNGGYGVHGEVEKSTSIGILATNKQTGNYVELARGDYGVHAVAFAGHGLFSQSNTGDGVISESTTAGKSGIYGYNKHDAGLGVFGRNTSTGSIGYLGGKYGVYGESGNLQPYAAGFKGNVAVFSRTSGAVVLELGEGLDYAEGFDILNPGEISPGSVVIIDPAHPGKLALSRQSYDRRVAGIVAGANGLRSGVRLGAEQFDYPVALAGRVYCNVDSTYGEVRPGDLLTTSPTPGFAMVVRDHNQAQGAILGKAMEQLPVGHQGHIMVLVTLQ